MSNQYSYFEVEPFELNSDVDEFEALEMETTDEAWQSEVGRRHRFPGRGTGYRHRPARSTHQRAPQRRYRARPSSRPVRPARPFPRPRRPSRRPRRPRSRLPVAYPYPWPPPEAGGDERVERSSEFVRWVQSSLNQVMNLRLPVDGVMGPATRSAIRSFQEKNGLLPDGIVGPPTEAALVAASKGGPPQARDTASEFQESETPAEFESEINRRSRDYIKWVQQSSKQTTPATQPALAQTTFNQLRVLADPSTPPTVGNALTIMKIICVYHSIPWRVGFTILEHEGGVRKFKHHDGVMQTINSARQSNIPLIPRPLKLAVLGLPASNTTSDTQLNARLHAGFPRRLTVQIAVGVQELKKNLDRFNGYVALAYQAYNAGAGWAYYTATRGKKKARPRNIGNLAWERMCLEGATLLHRLPRQIRADTGVWQCDKNIPTWFKHIPVFDRKTGFQLIAYKYLRSFVGQIQKNPPSIPCNQTTHRTRQQGTGPMISEKSRNGSLDKLYDPAKLSASYFQAVKSEIGALTDDGNPLKIENGKLVKKQAANI